MIPLTKGMTMIGRVASNDVVLDEQGVSRQHARIKADSDGYWLFDSGSRNGTFVNDERLGGTPQRLRHLDRIRLSGKTAVFWVFLESQATIGVSTAPPNR